MLPAAEGDDATRHVIYPDDTQIFPIQMELFDFFGLHVNRLHLFRTTLEGVEESTSAQIQSKLCLKALITKLT